MLAKIQTRADIEQHDVSSGLHAWDVPTSMTLQSLELVNDVLLNMGEQIRMCKI